MGTETDREAQTVILCAVKALNICRSRSGIVNDVVQEAKQIEKIFARDNDF